MEKSDDGVDLTASKNPLLDSISKEYGYSAPIVKKETANDKPKEYWFHTDDARSAEECENRDRAKWEPYVKKSDYDRLLSDMKQVHKALSDLLFGVAFVCGDLASTISSDPEHQKWLAVTAKYTRNRLIEMSDKAMPICFEKKYWKE